MLYTLLYIQSILMLLYYMFVKTVISRVWYPAHKPKEKWSWKDSISAFILCSCWPFTFVVFCITFKKEIKARFSKKDDASQE